MGPQQTEDCEIVPHEECEHIVEKIPKKVSKKITKVVCDENEDEKEEPTEIAEEEATNNDDNTNNIINDIFEIFGITNNRENEIEDEKLVPVTTTTTEFMIDDGLLSELTTKTAATSTTTTTLRTSTVTDLENIPTETVRTEERRMDGSKIIFSDTELDARNKDLAHRICSHDLRGSSQQDIFP